MSDVKVIEKVSKSGKVNLLMKWNENGRPKQQKLDLYYLSGKTIEIKTFNLQVKKQVDELVMQKEMELLQGTKIAKTPVFLEFCKSVMKSRTIATGTYMLWMRSIKVMSDFLEEKKLSNITTDKITPSLLDEFGKYVANRKNGRTKRNDKLGAGTANNICSKIITVIREGLKYDYFPVSCISAIKKQKCVKKVVEYLTSDEIDAMIKTDYKYKYIRYAFIISLYTGLRISDVRKLKWSDVNFDDYTIEVTTQKTKTHAFIPIGKKLMVEVFSKLTKPILDNDEFVLPEIHKSNISSINYHIKKWASLSGITKHIHFHMSRHSLAVNLISNGIGIYEVSKILTHNSVRTTEQFYADLTDKKKREALDKLSY